MNLTIPEEFPISEKERELFKKKFLIFLAWCGKYGNAVYNPAFLQPTKNCPDSCPFQDHCVPKAGNYQALNQLIHWIMEANID